MKQITTLAAVVLLLGASFGQNKTRDQSTFTFTVSGVTQVMVDGVGTQYNQWEVVPAGSPASLTVTIAGCIRGGTCSATLATSSGTSAQILNTTGVYDYYNVTASWTGGTRVAVTVNRTATLALSGGGSGTVASGPAIITSGLLAEYRMTTGSGTTLVDSSSNGNDATFPGGANNPTWISTGGLTFTRASNQFIALPAALNAATTVILVTNFSVQGSTTWYSPLVSNTAAGAANCWGIMYSTFNQVDVNLQRVNIWNGGTSQEYGASIAPMGIHVLGVERDTTNDRIYFDNVLAGNVIGGVTNASGSLTINGQFNLGGGNSTCPGGARNTNAFTGTIYYAAFYNRKLTDAEYLQNYSNIQQMLFNRGISIPQGWQGPTNIGVLYGDSEGTLIPNTTYVLNNGLTEYNLGASGTTPEQDLATFNATILPMLPTTGLAFMLEWSGTNDSGGSATTTFQVVAANARQARKAGFKTVFMSMMSRTGSDTFKNSFNALVRQNQGLWDEFIDVGGDVNLGCDGCSTNTTNISAGLHLTTHSANNIAGPMISRGINRLFGNNSFTTAATYTTTAAAAVATTAGSEATQTVTLTFGATPANCQVGNMITVAGTTPAGYSGSFQILTRTATQVTYIGSTTGFGVITVQGTGVCPVQQDADVYAILGGSATSPSFTLETCSGYTGQNLYIKNTNTTSPWVITPFSTAETIDGATSLTMPTASSGNFPVVVLQSQLISPAAGGCTWKRIQ